MRREAANVGMSGSCVFLLRDTYVRRSLNSLKRCYIGGYIGQYYRGGRDDTRSVYTTAHFTYWGNNRGYRVRVENPRT